MEGHLALELCFYGSRVYIRKVKNPEHWDPPPAPGDQIVSINGRPASSVVARAASRMPASTRRHLYARLSDYLTFPLEGLDLESGITIVVEKPDGKHVELCGSPGGGSRRDSQPISLEWVSPSVAHVTIKSFIPARWFTVQPGLEVAPGHDSRIPECIKMIDLVFSEVAKAKTLILDLRGNDGGTDTLGEHVARHLLEPGFTYYDLVVRHSEILARHQLANMKHFARTGRSAGIRPEYVEKLQDIDIENTDPESFGIPISGWSAGLTHKPPSQQGVEPFRGNVILLIDGPCFSADDNFVACIQDQHSDVLVLGSGTGGGTGAPTPVNLPQTKVQITFCTMKVYRPSGGLIEGIGSEPDWVVMPTPDDLRFFRDPVLDSAIALCT